MASMRLSLSEDGAVDIERMDGPYEFVKDDESQIIESNPRKRGHFELSIPRGCRVTKWNAFNARN